MIPTCNERVKWLAPQFSPTFHQSLSLLTDADGIMLGHVMKLSLPARTRRVSTWTRPTGWATNCS